VSRGTTSTQYVMVPVSELCTWYVDPVRWEVRCCHWLHLWPLTRCSTWCCHSSRKWASRPLMLSG
jgi:hypothetical protein